MAAPLFSGDTELHIRGELVSKPYIDITLHIMAVFGVQVRHENYQVFHIRGQQQYVSPGIIWSKAMPRRLPIFWRRQPFAVALCA